MTFGEAHPAEEGALVGTNVYVRTITMHYTGHVDAITDRWLILTDCAWVADAGARWAQSLADGTLAEVEPYPDGPVWVALGAVLDVSQWRHELPRTQLPPV